jgi:hypothetical protein
MRQEWFTAAELQAAGVDKNIVDKLVYHFPAMRLARVRTGHDGDICRAEAEFHISALPKRFRPMVEILVPEKIEAQICRLGIWRSVDAITERAG